MIASIVLVSYFGVGGIIATAAITSLDEDIKMYEEDAPIDNKTENFLKELERFNKMLGGKTIITITFIGISIFWLPAVVTIGLNRLLKK